MNAVSDSEPDPPAWPDWRDEEQYRHMLDLDRAGWAWEWVRRSPDYAENLRDEQPTDSRRQTSDRRRTDIVLLEQMPSRWGLCFP